jgi:hypothetical protein
MRVAHPREVGGARHGVELLEQGVVEHRALGLADAARLVGQVAEHDRLGRAGALAGRDDLAVADAAALVVGVDAGAGDALRAVGALLHHAAAAHGDVGVVRQRQLGGVGRELGVLQVVEAAHLVGAVVGAVAGADAAVVDHHVQALAVVDRRGDRADRLARRLLAVLAGHRHVEEVGVVEPAAVVGVDADPVHLAPDQHLVLADDRDVVLGLAGGDAGVAAGADGHVDDHAPLVRVVLPVGEDVRLVVRDGVHEGGWSGSARSSASVPARTMWRRSPVPSRLWCGCVVARR